jgi:hypothetical protein
MIRATHSSTHLVDKEQNIGVTGFVVVNQAIKMFQIYILPYMEIWKEQNENF